MLFCIICQVKKFILIVMDSSDQVQMMLEVIKVELIDNLWFVMDFFEYVGKGCVWNVGVVLMVIDIKLQVFGLGKWMCGIWYGLFWFDLVLFDDIENDENVQQKIQCDKFECWVKKVVMLFGLLDGLMDIIYFNMILYYDGVVNCVYCSLLWELYKFCVIIEWLKWLDLWEKWEEVFLNEGEEVCDVFYVQCKVEMDDGVVVLWLVMCLLLCLMKICVNDYYVFDCEYQNDLINSENVLFQKLVYWVYLFDVWIFFGVYDLLMGKYNKGCDLCVCLVGGFNCKIGVFDVVEVKIVCMLFNFQIEMIIVFQE